ncbi:unnamed protein product, partial [Polarella glacialis]
DELPALMNKDVKYGDLLKETMTLEAEDPMEELRRMVRKCRTKMDSQTKVLNGFISEVGLVKGMDRSFSCTEFATTGAGPQALTAGSRGRGIPGQRSLQ